MPRTEPVSPELVLVAPPEEAQRAREQLADPPARQNPVAERPAEEWDELLARFRAEPLPPDAEEPPVELQPPRRRRWRRPAAGVAALVLALLVGVTWARRDSEQPRLVGPTSASPSVTRQAVKPPPAPVKPPPAPVKPKTRAKKPVAARSTPAPPRRPAKSAPQPQRNAAKRPARIRAAFVPSRVWSWAPVRGSASYRVRFFRNGRLVLDVRAVKARLVLPKSFAFHKGRYRWTVVPLAAGKPPRPVVDSTFVVARG